jgi:hypothetical protein
MNHREHDYKFRRRGPCRLVGRWHPQMESGISRRIFWGSRMADELHDIKAHQPPRHFPQTIWVPFMKRPAFAILIAVLNSFSHAGWERIVEYDSGDIYVDAATIQRKGQRSTMTSLLNMSPRETNMEKATTWFKSVTQLDEYDCMGRRTRIKSFSLYSEAMGRGKLISTSNEATPWIPIESGSWNERKWRVACSE